MANKIFSVYRKYEFLAAHNLEGRPLHIHRFEVVFCFSGSRASFPAEHRNTLLINFHDINHIWKTWILPRLIDPQHRITITNSTCEAIAEWLFEQMDSQHERYYWCRFESVSVSDGDIAVIVKND